MKDPRQKRKQLWNVIIPQVCTEVINKMIILAIEIFRKISIRHGIISLLFLCRVEFKPIRQVVVLGGLVFFVLRVCLIRPALNTTYLTSSN